MSNETSPPGSSITSEERNWAMLCHLSALAGLVIPSGHVIGPLVVWLMKKDQFPFVDDQGKESLNFQISVTIYLAAALATLLILIGIVLVPAVLIFSLVMVILAGVKASAGEAYRYPLCIRFIK